jgi:hypothetical protein
MNITIGTINLTDKNSPRVNVKFDYYRTDTNVIIGGKKILTINGSISLGDDGSTTGATIMAQLKSIRDIGRNKNGGSCVNVNIPDFYTGMARIDNINIEQGPDPSWVNQGAFSITIEAPLDSIPPNNYGITAQDRVKSLSFSEKIELGEDSHGYVYLSNQTLSKSFVKFLCRVSVEVDPICQTIDTKTLVENIIRRFLKTSPSHNLLNNYKTWRVYVQDRSYEITNSNSATFSSESILLHPSTGTSSAYVELNFKHSKNYQSDDETKTISGNVRGLVNIPWSNIATLSSHNSTSKIASAESTYLTIQSTMQNITSWEGIEYELFRYNCPTVNPSDPCNASQDPKNKKDCIKPSTSNVNRSRTEGSIDFSFEWVNSDCAKNNTNSTTIEYSVDDEKMQPTVISHTIPTIGLLLQDLNCYTARKISFTSTLNFPSANCPGFSRDCGQEGKLELEIQTYFISKGMSYSDFIMTEYIKTRSNRSNVVKKSFISKCSTPIS